VLLKTDVLIIGSEGAGARAAIAAHDAGAQVLVVTKGRLGRSGATITALADMDVDSRSAKEVLGLPGDPNDSQQIFFEDVLIEGKYINNQKLVDVHVADAPVRIKELMEWGLPVRDLVRTPGHRFPRGVHASGNDMMKVLKKQVRKRNIKVIEDMMVVDLLTAKDVVIGAVGLNLRSGEFVTISAKATIIATGGGMMAYPIQTAPQELTGDGQAIAYRAGAELVDMEMVQFHPCDFLWPPAWRGIGFPFTIGPAGGMDVWLLNRYGQRFMSKWDPERMEKTTRDNLSIGIMTEILEGRGTPSGGVYMSLAHLPHNLIDYYVEWASKGGFAVRPGWKYQGFNFKELMERVKNGYAMEVGPACHFFMGGIRVNENGETSLPGLYAAGEVAGGLHGANRLSGNACTQIFVQGERAGSRVARWAKGAEQVEPNKGQVKGIEKKLLKYLRSDGGPRPFKVRKELQELAWKKAGIIREGDSLEEALTWLSELKRDTLPRLSTGATERAYNREWIEAIQLENLVIILEAIARAALLRGESRGAHFRRDFKETSREWLCNIVIRNDRGKMSSSVQQIVTTRMKPEDFYNEP
jgi:succinate dehydrogenase/fumarate reductase flavoprotein subunit